VAGRLDGAYWLIGPGSASLAQGCYCMPPLQAWAAAYRGGRPLTACIVRKIKMARNHQSRVLPSENGD